MARLESKTWVNVRICCSESQNEFIQARLHLFQVLLLRRGFYDFIVETCCTSMEPSIFFNLILQSVTFKLIDCKTMLETTERNVFAGISSKVPVPIMATSYSLKSGSILTYLRNNGIISPR